LESYKSWDYCKEHCDMYQKWADSEERVYMMCGDCHVYQFHQYLKEHGQILEEGSELLAVVEAAKKLTDLIEGGAK
jgi:hypothetical protein